MKTIDKVFAFAIGGLLMLISNDLNAQQIISIERSIEIEADQSLVLGYVSDLLKDPIWRAEVDSMVLIESNEYGNGAVEYSSFGKRNVTVTPTFLTKTSDHSVTFETPDTANYYLASVRNVEQVSDGVILVTYVLRFDNNMTKEISPFKIPKGITKMFYGRRMKNYLKVLKQELEA